MILGIYGSNGLGREVLELANSINKNERWDSIIFIDDTKDECIINETRVYSFSQSIKLFDASEIEYVIATGEPASRDIMYSKVISSCRKLATLIAANTFVPNSTSVGAGCVIHTGNALLTNVFVGDNVYIQPNSVLGHDVIVGKHSVISANSFIGGYGKIGDCTYIAPHVCVRDRVSVGRNCIIGMGSVVLNDISDNNVVVGAPAKRIRDNNERKVFK